MRSTTEIIKESEEIGNKIKEIMQKSGCSNEDYEKSFDNAYTHLFMRFWSWKGMCCEMKVLLGYKDIMALGFSKKTAYKMLNLICESEDYKKSNLAKVIDSKKVPTKLFVKMFPEFKEVVGCEKWWT